MILQTHRGDRFTCSAAGSVVEVVRSPAVLNWLALRGRERGRERDTVSIELLLTLTAHL